MSLAWAALFLIMAALFESIAPDTSRPIRFLGPPPRETLPAFLYSDDGIPDRTRPAPA